jgi:UDP-N-acetylmuramyl pentapeptide synthase
MTMRQQLIDLLAHRGKRVAKSVYRQPVIGLAGLWRRLLRRTCYVGITGSAGKTTTKDLLYLALSQRYRCTRSLDSNNQLYGLARTLTRTGPRTQFMIQELGAGELGGFDPMLAMLAPRVAAVTNVGTDHFSHFHGREGVAAEKGKLVACLPADGVAVLNADDPMVMGMAARCRARVVTFGMSAGADLRAEITAEHWPDRLALRIHHGDEAVGLQTRLLGAHQVTNVLAALAAASMLGVTLAEAAAAIARYEPMLGRLSVHPTGAGVTFLRDDWKAPQWSLSIAFQYLANARAIRKLIILGTISDYGGSSRRAYRRAVTQALQCADQVLVVGPRAHSVMAHFGVASGSRVQGCDTVQTAVHWLKDNARPGDLILLKGSSGDHLARLPLSLDQPVRCWRSRCGRAIFCDHCRMLRVPA